MSWAMDLGIVIPAFLVGLAAQWWVRHVLAEAEEMPSSLGVSGRRTAERLLRAAGISGVAIEAAPDEELGDHYEGRLKTIRLLDADAATVASIAVAAHEVGHAAQDAARSAIFRVRGAIAPVAAIASVGCLVLVFFGFLLGIAGLIHVAVLLFAAVAVFHLVTLPVEIDASRRALVLLSAGGLVTESEERVVRRVLVAAALTYVATALISIGQVVEFLFMGEE